MTPPAQKVARHLRSLPAPITLIVILLCLVLRENFPFSHLPMYSNLTSSTSYVYVADKAGQPIAIETLTGERTGGIKKLFRTNLAPAVQQAKEEGTYESEELLTPEQRRPAGDATLQTMLDDLEPRRRASLAPHRPLQLYQVYVHIEGTKIIYDDPILVGTEAP